MVLVSPSVKSEFDKIKIKHSTIVFVCRYLVTGNPQNGVMDASLCDYIRSWSRMHKSGRAEEEAKFSDVQC